MIRTTLLRTKEATWALFVPHPDPETHGVPIPSGTCFFVDPTGFALTANHVIADEAGAERSIVWLQRPATPPDWGMAMIEGVLIVERWPEFDLALLKADFAANSSKRWASGLTDFPYVPLSFDPVLDGTPVYSYGYPLPPQTEVHAAENVIIATGGLGPRTTSAIIAAGTETFGPVQSPEEPRFYVTDKAFNYGNSGGPLVLQENGYAIGVVTRFQPVGIKQENAPAVWIPSLYGIASSAANILDRLRVLVPLYS